MTTTVVSNGVTSSGLTLSGGDTLNVLAGGTIHDIADSGGQINLAGISTSNVAIFTGGTEVISAGGVASGASGSGTGVSGGSLTVLSGGTLAFSKDIAGGVTGVASGGTAYNLSVSSGGTLNVAGTTQSNVQVFTSGIENVQSGGLITGNFGSGTGVVGGTLNVLAGGSGAFITVSSGGTMNVAGTVLSNVAVISGGIENVLSGGLISGVTSSGTGVSAGGTLNILAGGSAVHVGVSSGGTFNVAGTVLSNTGVYSGGVENVLVGGVIGGASGSGTGVSGGTLNLLAGGSASFVGVSSGGIFNVAGIFLSEGGVVSGGVENVLSGGLTSGASGSGTGVSSGGTMNVLAGGSGSYIGVSSGGILNISSGGRLEFSTDSGGTTNILAGGKADSLTVSSGGILNVAGTVTSNVAVSSGGVENVLAGGLISAGGSGVGTWVSAGGTLNVQGLTSNTVVVQSGGVENVSSGGVIQGTISGSAGTGTFIESGGTLNVLAGGSASMLSISGTLNVQGEVLSNVTIWAGGLEIVSSGGVVTGVTGSGTADDGTVDVLSGGSLEHLSVSSGGLLTVSAGGTADHVTVSSGGTFNVLGTVLSNVAVDSGGVENISSGGFTSGASGSGTGISGGTVNLLAGGSATFVGVSSGGIFNVYGTVLSDGAVYSGGIEYVQSGGLISGASGSGTGVSGGTLNILAGGSAAFVGVSSGGTLNVYGTVLSNTGVVSGGIENVQSGGLISGASGLGTGISGGTVNVLAGGSAAYVGVSGGGGGYGTLNVSSGGQLEFSTDYSSGITYISAGGKADSLTVSSGGFLLVAGTTTSFVTVSSGGTEYVLSGGLMSGNNSGSSAGNSIAGGTLNVLAGGSAVVVNVSSGGTLNVSSGGQLEFSIDSGGGTTNILAGAEADKLTVSAGGLLNVAGTTTSDVAVDSGGIENVLSGGLISGGPGSGTGIAGGTLNVLAGGSAAFVGVSSGGALNVAGTVLSKVGVYSGGTENEQSGGLIRGAAGSGYGISGGTLNVSYGGIAAFVGVSSGGTAFVSSGGYLYNSTDYSSGVTNVQAGGFADHLLVSGGATFNVAGTTLSNVGVFGVENVLSGGLISGAPGSGTGISAGGTVNILTGGTAAFIGVSSGGTLNVAGTVKSNNSVNSSGVENILSGGVVSGAVVSGGGVLSVSSGGTAAVATILSGGLEFVSSGGIVGESVISGGTLELASGATTSGAIVAFVGTGGVLKIDGTSSLSGGTIYGIGGGDIIDLAGSTFASGGSATVLAGNVLHVVESGVTYNLQLDPNANFTGKTFGVSSDGGTGTDVELEPNLTEYVSVSNTTLAAGGSTTVGAYTMNLGSVAAGGSTGGIYLSTTPTITTSDTLLATVTSPGLTDVSQSGYYNLQNVVVTLPGNLAPGTYYIGGIADTGNAVLESNENDNNYNAVQITVTEPNLTEYVTVSNTKLSAGASVTIGAYTMNLGKVAAPGSTGGIYLSTDSTITTSDTLLATVTSPGLTDVSQSGYYNLQNLTVTLPGNLAPGTYYIGGIADNTNAVAESNETDNNYNTVQITVGAPNLTEYVTVSNTTLAAGATTTVGAYTMNLGSVAAPGSTGGIYLSTDSTITTSDTLLATVTSPGLTDVSQSGYYNLQNATATLPGNLAPGTYYIGGIADTANAVAETSESDNTYNTVQITVAQPNLTEYVTVSNTTLAPGASTTIGAYTMDLGSVSAPGSTGGIYLSTDSTITTADTLLATVTSPGLTPVGTSGYYNLQNIAVTLPGNLAPGTYYIGGISNNNNAVVESSGDNNTYNTVQITVADPTLTEYVTVSNTALSAGATTTIGAYTMDLGSVSAPGSTGGIYLSTDSTITTADTLLATVTSPGLTPVGTSGYYNLQNITVTLPGNLAPGTYYIGGISNNNNAIVESSGDNNTYNTVQITVADPTLTEYVTVSNTTLSAGATTTVGAYTMDLGSVSAPGSTGGIYLSTDSTITTADTLLATVTSPGLTPVGTSGYDDVQNVTVTLPGNLAPGTYYIGGISNNNNAVVESSGDNNTYNTVQITVGKPDLTAYVATNTTSVAAGTAFAVNLYDMNLGSFTAPTSQTALYISTDSTITSSDTLLKTVSAPELTPVGTSGYYDIQNVSVTAPVGLAPGTYYIGGIANANGSIAETNTANNTYDTVKVTITAPAQSSSNPITIASGASAEIAGSSAQAVTYSGSTGNLTLDSSASFSGTVAGMAGQDTIDLTDVSFATLLHQPTYTGTSSGGTLTVQDGAHTINIALLGNYLSSTFVATNDGHGGTSVVDPPATQTNPLISLNTQNAHA